MEKAAEPGSLAAQQGPADQKLTAVRVQTQVDEQGGSRWMIPSPSTLQWPLSLLSTALFMLGAWLAHITQGQEVDG